MLSYFEDTDRIGSAFHLLDIACRCRTSSGPQSGSMTTTGYNKPINMEDRSLMVPQHAGYSVLPNTVLLFLSTSLSC